MRLLQCQVDGFGDAIQTIRLADFVQMTARMEVEVLESQLLATLHLVDKSGSGFCEPGCFGMPEIDEVAVVGKDLIRCVTCGSAVLFKTADGSFRQRFGLPLTLVFGKKGKGGGADGGGIEGSVSTPPAALTWAPIYFMGEFLSGLDS